MALRARLCSLGALHTGSSRTGSASEAAPNAPPLREVPRVGKLEARAETLSQGRAVHQTGSFSQS